MKTLIIILFSLLFLSCDITEPEQSETINCKYLYMTESGKYIAGYTMMGVYSITYNGTEYGTFQSDVIKVNIKNGKLENFDIYRYNKQYHYEAKSTYKYYWNKK